MQNNMSYCARSYTGRRRRQHLRTVFFTGPTGCGKTFVLRLVMDLYNRYSNTGNNNTYNAFVICASTAKAAVAVGVTTVHGAFKLSRNTTGPNKDGGLSASELNTFRAAFRNVKCVIIDEVSMMPADNLNEVDLSRPHGCFAYYSGFPYGKMVIFFLLRDVTLTGQSGWHALARYACLRAPFVRLVRRGGGGGG
ncbi:hypothetical protein HPB48_011870 [Haemaphysalis longicornis]|uniref:AAA+ ATPase domain-containing protein n=1 Tax=Haemaphysalis longicornis TaxID=44386 RepID=A0A9J6FJA7_HAELO|nr:hypothetical protein HPB48_011870 [Haemaphysalis longicornis]